MTAVELDAVSVDYLRWINPGDYRVTEQTCGVSGCHESIVETAPSSIMTTMAGHFNKPRYHVGSQDTRDALLGVRDQVDDNWDGEVGTVSDHAVLVPPPLDADSEIGEFVDHYLAKGCPRCHVWNFGSNDARGDFRSSGCTGCHMVYADDGLSQSLDTMINHDDPVHPKEHVLTTSIPDMQCEHCHYRGNRIGTMYRGVREAGRLGESENIELSVETYHTRGPGFFVYDEDTTNDIDETPPDLHHTAGLGCVDCHMGGDVHGTGKLYGAHDYQVGVECEDCHGTRTTPVTPGADGLFTNESGDVMKMLFVDGEENPVMTGRLSGDTHPLAQVADTTVDAHTANHLDNLECYACHTAWTQSCFGCHPTIDTRSDSKNLIDGTVTPGRAGGTRDYVTLDYLALGVGTDGKLTPMAPQEKMFVTTIVPCDPNTETCTEDVDSVAPGRRIHDRQVRVAEDGTLGMGFAPVVPHTTSTTSQPCDRCHLRDDESNADIVAETLGFGSNRFVIPDGAGVDYDLTRVMDENCTPEVSLAHEGTSTLPCDQVDRMMTPRVPDSGLVLKTFPAWEAP